MKTSIQILFSCLFVALMAIPGFSQNTSSIPSHNENNTESKTAGLRKIASGSGLRDMDIEVNIDEEAIEAAV